MIRGDVSLTAHDKIAIVVANFEPEISEKLIESTVAETKKIGGDPSQIEMVQVPGALEVPFALELLLKKGGFRCYLALGCVIRGETTHYDVVVNECVRGCNDLVREFTVPFGFGIITANTYAQAEARAGTDRCVGRMALRAAVEMASLNQKLSGDSK